MSRTEGKNLRVLLYEGPGSTPLENDARYQALSSLLNNGFEVTRPVEGQQVAPPDDSPLLILGLLENSPDVAANVEVHVRNLADVSALDAACEVRDETGARALEAWKPWFPVIDFDRCTNCMQCLTFCLFDVYGVDNQQNITVQNQEIEQMQTWLQEWYGITYEPQLSTGDMASMQRLDQFTGAEYEIRFMQSMIRHHWAAVREAETCLDRAEHQDLLQLCQNIKTVQLSEIEQMQIWLEEWYDRQGGRPASTA